MNINIPQSYFSKLMRAVVEFELIEQGDRILIGVSGGKDSIFLTYALAILRERLKRDFYIAAFTVNPQFDEPFDTASIASFCRSLDIAYEVVDVDIAGAIAAQDDKSPCFTCAFFRRGAVNRYAVAHRMNKVAYAHHHDDAVETFLMSLFYSGQLNTFRPKTYLDKTDITVIRPLVYFREQEIIDATRYHGFTPVPSPCPHNGNTTRQTVKELIAHLSAENPNLYNHLAAGMREGALGELWPASKTRKEMERTYRAFMQKS